MSKSSPVKNEMFNAVEPSPSFPKLEEEILKFWKDSAIYDKSLERRKGREKYVFFEGPPTANGKPHPGHCLTRAIKDLFPRYKTMQGFYCERKAGWDTHGLPVEVEVCKELGIHSKEEIENHGVEPFIQDCQRSVWKYMQEWERLTERLGFWVKLDEAYVTYHKTYVESVWWSLKNLFDRGLLYQGHKIIWWWAQGGTALSSGEVGQGYKTVMDPSVFVLFPLVSQENTSLLVWTTTPWTLPSNQFAAVNADLEYVTVYDAELDTNIVFAKDLVEKISEKLKRDLEVKSTCKGSDLIGQRYVPPFDYYYSKLGNATGTLKAGGQEHVAWRITAADFVTTDSGSGAVHEAPAFGEVDYELLITEQARFVDGEGPQLICAVGPNGRFTDEAPDYEGQWVKDADKPITRKLKELGVLYLQEQYQHEYPFCWRADDDPLIQYPRKSWFVRTKRFRDSMLANNKQINWLPDHIRDGRFGNFLESNVDWALSRERYWGTPLPIWQCEKTGKQEAISNYEELLAKPGLVGTEFWESAKAKNPDLPDDLKVHKPYVDAIQYDSPFEAGAKMTRVPEVIDCWYDSGAMPFAQWGYPHQGKDQFESQFPADFISEAIDQTRGWFYSLLAISTLLFPEDEESSSKTEFPHPFKNCIVLGLMLGEDGHKMSKSKRNYREPNEIFDKYGADALRWYFYANQPPWTAIRYREQSIKESIPEFILRLWNVFSFFVLYANLDNFDPTSDAKTDQLNREDFASNNSYRPVADRSELDRWVISELNRTVDSVVKSMDSYDNYGAANNISSFVDAVSNWYVRRSRDRFWSEDKQDQNKLDAYWTLYDCLLTLSKLTAPFVPFVAEAIWKNLSGSFGTAPESVHLCDYPEADTDLIDPTLSEQMNLLRELASLGRSARMNAKLKVRQPLSGVTVILNDETHLAWLQSHGEILQTELNVKDVTYTSDAGEFVTYQVIPNFKRVGPRVGKLMPQVKKALSDADGGQMLNELEANGVVNLEVGGEIVDLDSEDIEVRLSANEGWAAAQGKNAVVVLATELTPELIRDGMARDVVRLVQDRRKELQLNFSDRIILGLVCDDEELKRAIEENISYIKKETLAVELQLTPIENAEPAEREIAGKPLTIYIRVQD